MREPMDMHAVMELVIGTVNPRANPIPNRMHAAKNKRYPSRFPSFTAVEIRALCWSTEEVTDTSLPETCSYGEVHPVTCLA